LAGRSEIIRHRVKVIIDALEQIDTEAYDLRLEITINKIPSVNAIRQTQTFDNT
jgi:hypothetical protein